MIPKQDKTDKVTKRLVQNTKIAIGLASLFLLIIARDYINRHPLILPLTILLLTILLRLKPKTLLITGITCTVIATIMNLLEHATQSNFTLKIALYFLVIAILVWITENQPEKKVVTKRKTTKAIAIIFLIIIGTASAYVVYQDSTLKESVTETFNKIKTFSPFNIILKRDVIKNKINESKDQEGILDSDQDGMPDNWENKYNLDPNDPKDSTLDPDNDGLTNLEEYKNKTDRKSVV